MSDSATYDAFISYASADLAFAEEAHRRLVKAGFSVWFDKSRLNPGCDWHKEIEAGCERSRVLLPVLTPRWKVSPWTKFETYGAEAVIPLIVEGDFADTSTPPLTRFQGQALDLSSQDDASWERLFEALRGLLARPAPEKLDRLLKTYSSISGVGRSGMGLGIFEAACKGFISYIPLNRSSKR
jgi:TIR domain